MLFEKTRFVEDIQDTHPSKILYLGIDASALILTAPSAYPQTPLHSYQNDQPPPILYCKEFNQSPGFYWWPNFDVQFSNGLLRLSQKVNLKTLCGLCFSSIFYGVAWKENYSCMAMKIRRNEPIKPFRVRKKKLWGGGTREWEWGFHHHLEVLGCG